MSSISHVSSDRHPSLLLLRHAEKAVVPSNSSVDTGLAASITEAGRRDSESFGHRLRRQLDAQNRRFRSAVSSPVHRCRDTLVYIIHGADFYPGSYLTAIQKTLTIEPELAGVGLVDLKQVNWVLYDPKLEIEAVFGEISIGEKSSKEVGEALFQLLVGILAESAPDDFSLVCSHDLFLLLIMARYFKIEDITEFWPEYLDGILLEQLEGGDYRMNWKGKSIRIRS